MLYFPTSQTRHSVSELNYNTDQKGTIRLMGHFTAKARPNLSFEHLRNAAYLASTCKPLEEDYTWPANDTVLAAHGAAATSTIILSVCAIEAAADEIRLTAKDRSEKQLGKLFKAAERIEGKWAEAKKLRPLKQYQWLLQQAKLPKMKAKEPTLKAAADLFDLRNGLVHWKAEWSDDAERSDGLEARLAGKFEHSRLAMPDQPFIPTRACGYGAAGWAVRTALGFLTMFAERIDAQLPVPLMAHRILEHLEEQAA